MGAVWADWEGFFTVENGWNYQVMKLWFLCNFFNRYFSVNWELAVFRVPSRYPKSGSPGKESP